MSSESWVKVSAPKKAAAKAPLTLGQISAANAKSRRAAGSSSAFAAGAATRSDDLPAKKRKFVADSFFSETFGNRSAHGSGPNAWKLDDDKGVYHHDRVSAHFSQELARMRAAKGLTQTQLAALISEKPAVLLEYERGTAIPNPLIIQKLNKALGASLPKSKA